jgi:hypothetical protein
MEVCRITTLLLYKLNLRLLIPLSLFISYKRINMHISLFLWHPARLHYEGPARLLCPAFIDNVHKLLFPFINATQMMTPSMEFFVLDGGSYLPPFDDNGSSSHRILFNTQHPPLHRTPPPLPDIRRIVWTRSVLRCQDEMGRQSQLAMWYDPTQLWEVTHR